MLRADGVTLEHMESMVPSRGEESSKGAGEEKRPAAEDGPGETAEVTIEQAEQPEPVTTETPAGDPPPEEAIPEID